MTTMTGRRACSPRWANGTLMARKIGYRPGVIKAQAGEPSLIWAFSLERVTGIEPALSAWGIRQIRAPDRPDLEIRCTASDRDGLCDTGVNGPPMARGAVCGA